MSSKDGKLAHKYWQVGYLALEQQSNKITGVYLALEYQSIKILVSVTTNGDILWRLWRRDATIPII